MEVKLNGVVIPPASGPPSGPAGGALAGTYPDPALNTANTAGDAVLKGTLTTAGDLIGASAANTPARVVPQAAGTVLTSNGVGVAATFQAAGAGTAIPKSILTAVGDIVSASGVATPAVIPATTAGLILTANGAGVQSTYQTNPAIASAAAAQTTANAAVAKSTATTTGDLYAASAPSTPTRIAGGAVGEVLTGNGAGVLPSFQAAGSGTAIPKSVLTAVGDLVSASAAGTPAVIPAVAAGRILRAAGAATVPAYSTLTVPDTAARGTVLVATGANTVTALAMQAVNTFGGGDGTDFVARTAAQHSGACG